VPMHVDRSPRPMVQSLPQSENASASRFQAAWACAVTFLVVAAGPTGHYAAEPLTLKGHTQVICSMAFSKDGKTLATLGDVIKLWDPGTGKELATFDTDLNSLCGVAFSPDGKSVAACGGNDDLKPGVELWDVEKRKRVDGPGRRTGYAGAVLFSPDAKTLAFGTPGGFVKLWDVADKKERDRLDLGVAVHVLAYSPDGKTLTASGSGGRICVWNAETGKEVHRLDTNIPEIDHLHYTPDGKTLVFINALLTKPAIQTWDLETGKDTMVYEPSADTDRIFAFALSPDGKLAALGLETGVLELRDAKTWKLKARQSAHGKYFLRLAFAPDGKYLATGGHDLLVKIWDVSKLLEQSADK